MPAKPRHASADRARAARRRSLALLLVAAAFLLCHSPVSSAGSFSRRSGLRELHPTASEVRTGVELPDVFIVAGSDSVLVAGKALARGTDYVLDHETGVLRVITPLEPSAEVTIVYSYVPIALERLHRRAVLESLAALPEGFAPEAVLVDPAGAGDRPPGPESGLSIGGAKTFGVTMGSNRDPSLEQSLRLNVNGRLTRDLSVAAYLSDQNTPLVPEGDTEELRALDEVLIEIEGRSASATLGDYTLELDGGPLARFRRDESGAMARARLGPAQVTLAGARSEGRFRSVSFRGVDGKQGAYLLTDDGGGTGVTVVAGSERVWVDGARMRRGRDNDYVIDYAGGAIEFTERRPIVAENEITVDYEYTSDDYRRDTYAGRVAFGAVPGAFNDSGDLGGSGSGMGLSFFREVDDRDGATGSSLSEKERGVLSAAGDDLSLAYDDGVDSVGVGSGDYVFVSEGVFEFAGADSGDYDLDFERLQGGDYVYDFIGDHYEYVGEGSGDYRLGRTLPLPSDHTLVATDARLRLGEEGFVEASVALSDHDRNTFSDIDDGDNLGNAQVVSAATPDIGLGGEGGARLGFALDARRVAGTFKGVGRFRELGYEERWELAGIELPGGEAMLQGSSSLRLGGGGSLKVSHALLERGEALESRRTEFEASARPTEGGRLWGSGRFVDSRWAGGAGRRERERAFYRAGFEQRAGPVRPGVAYAHDERTENGAGERYDEYGASVESAEAGDISFRASYARRFTDRADGDAGDGDGEAGDGEAGGGEAGGGDTDGGEAGAGENGGGEADGGGAWTRASETVTQEYRVGFSRWEALRIDGSVVRRRTEFESGFDESGSKYDLASVRLDHTSLGGGLTGQVRYSVTATEIEERERFVTEEDGVEVTRVVRTGNYLPVTDLTASTKWKYGPGRASRARNSMPEPSALGRFLAGLTVTSDVKLREMTRTEEKRRLYLLDPSVLQGDDTVRGEVTSRHTARFLSSGSAFSLRLAAHTKDALDRSYINDSTRTKTRSGTVDAKFTRPGGVTYRAQVDAGSRERDSDSRDDYEIDETALLGEAAFRKLGDLEARLTASVRNERDAVTGVDVLVSKVTPAVTYRLAGRGALTASVTRVEVTPRSGELSGLLHVAEGRREGLSAEWRLNGDYRFNQFLTGSLVYSGEARSGSDPLHTLDLRVNAFF